MEVPRVVVTSPKQSSPRKRPTSAVESFMNLIDGCTVVPSAATSCQHPCVAGPSTAAAAGEGRDDADTDDGVAGSRDKVGSVARALDYVRKKAISCGCSLAMILEDYQMRDDNCDDGNHHEGRIIDVPIKSIDVPIKSGEEDTTNRPEKLATSGDISLLTDTTPHSFQRRYYDVSDGMRIRVPTVDSAGYI